MDQLVIAHVVLVVLVCSNLQLNVKKVFVAVKEKMLCVFYATAMAHWRVGNIF